MKDNHLIIGIGGTGGKILASYRKLFAEKFNGNMSPDGVWVDYIYIDSSETDLRATGGIWNVLGTSVALEPNSLVSIKAADLKAYVENIDNYPYLRTFIGNGDDFKHIINDPKIQDGAAGQKRRLGRFLFANGIPKFIEKVDSKVKSLQANPEGQHVTFHICCGLAGGTGSGSFIDIVSQIKNTYKDRENYKILLYLLLPEEIPNMSWATTDNYQPNGYAALMELNALDFQIFKPHNIGERGGEVSRLENSAPFYSAYIITEQNSRNVKFDVDKSLPPTIAEFIFQKTLLVSGEANKASMLQRAETGENPKYSEYGFFHSFKFLTFGIKRLAIPEQEIKEYFTYSLVKQALLQSLYNHPSTELGFTDEPIGDVYSEATKKENLDRWGLTIPFFCLSAPFLDDHKKEGWVSINEEYNCVDRYKQDALSDGTLSHQAKLSEILKQTDIYFKTKFRKISQDGGVTNFFNGKEKRSLEELPKYIVKEIEQDFFKSWENGLFSLYGFSQRLDSLMQYLDDQYRRIEQMTVDAKTTITNSEAKIKELNTKWSNLSILEKLIATKKDSISNEFTNEVKKKYQIQTWLQGYNFAKLLIHNIKTRMAVLKGEIDTASSVFSGILKNVNDEINTKCATKSEDDNQSIIIKYYDPAKVRTVTSQVMKNRNYIDHHVTIIRKGVVSLLGEENNSFAKIKSIGKEGILNYMEKVGAQMTNTLFTGNSGNEIVGFEKLVGENVFKKLKEEFGGNDEGLKAKLDELVKHAAVLGRYDEVQVNDGPAIRKSLLIIIPEYKEDVDFTKKVINIFKGIIAGDQFQIVQNGKPNEIVIMNIESNITLRYLRSVGVLREKYDRLVASPNGKVAKFETHLESFEKDLPSLYKPSMLEKQQMQNKIREDAVPYIVLAKSLNLLQPYEDPETGAKRLAIISKEDRFLQNVIMLGKDLVDSLKYINEEISVKLQSEVLNILKSDYKHTDNQAKLEDLVVGELELIRALFNNNINDATVKLFYSGGAKASQMINKIND